ncbi:hypothetical protein M2150_001949 [Lachnospiraceae bacterium PM6-15]|uniref:subtype B tannase n=1 Tax=Ohessyouella blattaphilus TaxID=2949333 RepID=UPI003E2986DC
MSKNMRISTDKKYKESGESIMVDKKLSFDKKQYVIKNCELNGVSVSYRAFEGLEYCAAPVHSVQKMNIYVPESFYKGTSINGWDLHSAPIYMPNTVGGYMQGPAMEPGKDMFTGQPNTAFEALRHGYVVACVGIRGRNTGEKNSEFFVGSGVERDSEDSGKLVGRAPALIIDLKAAIRYLRYNQKDVPGNTERIITNGTSAGGALSALAGATGNMPEYEPYLKEIGAVRGRDDIFAASCYCPIHNLEHADAAYEWMFCGYNEFHKMNFEQVNGKIVPVPVKGVQTPEQIAISKALKPLFSPYLNGLNLRDDSGKLLTLDAEGKGDFKEYIRSLLICSAQKEVEMRDSSIRHNGLLVPGSEIEEQAYLTVREGRVIDLDWDAFVSKIMRMKTAPAFDALDLSSPENEEFGDENVYARHFTKFGQTNDTVKGEIADEGKIRLLNPTLHVGGEGTARHWRIRHGAFDRDTSLAIPVILATLLKNKGYDVDFALPWGVPHSGDYDINEQFAWIDKICRKD